MTTRGIGCLREKISNSELSDHDISRGHANDIELGDQDGLELGDKYLSPGHAGGLELSDQGLSPGHTNGLELSDQGLSPGHTDGLELMSHNCFSLCGPVQQAVYPNSLSLWGKFDRLGV